jgi:Fic family protein
LAVSSNDDWIGWCEFFLNALARQAAANEDKARRILALYQEKKEWMIKTTHSQHAIAALDFFFGRPIFNSSDFVAGSHVPEATARRVLRLCRGKRFLKEVRTASGRTPAIFAFTELLNITEGRSVF